MKITCTAHIGDESVAREFVQLVRAFDVAYPGECMIQIFVDAPKNTVDEMEQLLNSIVPPLPYRKTVMKKP